MVKLCWVAAAGHSAVSNGTSTRSACMVRGMCSYARNSTSKAATKSALSIIRLSANSQRYQIRSTRSFASLQATATESAAVAESSQRIHENILDVLRSRGLVEQVTGDAEGKELKELCDKTSIAAYVGFDPTADSLHLGNLLGILVLRWFQRCGHIPIALIGGATGKVGDPSGKSSERPVLDDATIQRNVEGIKANIQQVLTSEPGLPEPIFVNNYDWIGPMSFLGFLRDVGKFARVGTMMAKDSVKNRLGADGEGMSFTEFTYQLLQAYDFVHLNRAHKVRIQMGGSDQWGNITAGIDLARRLEVPDQLHALTFPLLVKADGKKFGKSESGAIWLSKDKLSPYEFYQHLFKITDSDVIHFLKKLTFLPLERIQEIENEMLNSKDYVPNTAQRILAEEITRIVHGEQGLRAAIAATQVAAPGKDAELDAATLELVAKDLPCAELGRSDVVGKPVIDVMVSSGLMKSKGEARRLLANGGVFVNNKKILEANAVIETSQLLDSRLVLLAAGKKNKMLVRVQ